MRNSEIYKFVYRHILPTIFLTAIIFFTAIYFLVPVELTFEVFTIITWSLITPSLFLSYQSRRWTLYEVKHHGLHMEENPVMRGMLARGDSKQYWSVWLCMCVFFLFLCLLPYIIEVNAQFYSILMIAPLCLFTITLHDFLNDFRVVKKVRLSNRV